MTPKPTGAISHIDIFTVDVIILTTPHMYKIFSDVLYCITIVKTEQWQMAKLWRTEQIFYFLAKI
jgi:hypothetical protein